MPQRPISERRLRLTAARLVGACALGVVAQIAVDMPEGYLGAADRVTRAGALFAGGLVVLTALAVVALVRRWPLTGWLAPTLFSLAVGLFAPAAVSDPVVAGVVVVWNLTLLAQHFFPSAAGVRPPAPAEGTAAGGDGASAVAVAAPALRHLATVSLLLIVAVVGYRLSGRSLAQGVCLVLGYGTLVAAWPALRELYRQGGRLVLAVPAPAVAGLAAVWSPRVTLSLLALSQALLLVALLARHQSTAEVLRSFYDHPSRLLLASFAVVILAGTVLLTFPAASAGPRPVTAIDALFTATSATCVTGLIVLDTPRAFSTFGHAVILSMIQVGGLGIMVLSTFATLILGGSLGLKGERALTEVLDIQAAPTAYRLTRFIVVSTLGVEAAGAAALAFFFADGSTSLASAVWRGVFHSVSAFCNAGFALESDSLVRFREHPAALLLVAGLITAGGLGFVVLAGLASRLAGRGRRRLNVQVRVVLAVSGALVAVGTGLYAACEWQRSLGGLSVGDKLVNALFQSVTLRTAGFNSVDLSLLAPATVLAMILFMFVGASPGSTGGGIKTTTAAVLLAAIRSTVRGGEPVTLFGREVPREIVLRSLAIVVISVSLVAFGLFLVLLFEPQPFVRLLFETVSAFGTVGLSLGATPDLGPAGKLVIIAIMFAGRLGPLTLALVLGAGRRRRPVCRYPETRLMVG